MALSHNNVFVEEERNMANFGFSLWSGSNSSNTTGSIDNLNTIGNAQEYPVSLYISKTNIFVGGIHV